MKFKRNIFIVLQREQEVTVPEDEFWDVTFGEGPSDANDKAFVLNMEASRFGANTRRAHLGGGVPKLNVIAVPVIVAA